MKLSQDHFLSERLSGNLFVMIFYNRFGKTYIRKAPGSYNNIPTEKQAVQRALFIQAHLFEQSVISDPVKKAIYTKKANSRCTAYSKAVSEYMLLNKNKVDS